MVSVAQVAEALQPWLGAQRVASLFSVLKEITFRLNLFTPRNDIFVLCDEISDMLYNSIYAETKGQMVIVPDGGYPVRLTEDDFYAMSDDILLFLFLDFPVDGAHLLLLRDYSMKKESLSALHALYTRFSSLETPDETAAIKRIAIGCYPPGRLKWLK